MCGSRALALHINVMFKPTWVSINKHDCLFSGKEKAQRG